MKFSDTTGAVAIGCYYAYYIAHRERTRHNNNIIMTQSTRRSTQ